MDFRVRFQWKGELFNFCLMSITLYELHTVDNMFEVMKWFLSAIFSDSWSKKCVDVSMYGAQNMTSRVQGLVTCIQDYYLPGML